MAELLLELFCEEIPARMQTQAAKRLQTALEKRFSDSALAFEHVETHAGPRRLIAIVQGLPSQTQAVHTERKGPRVSAPQTAIDGFCKSAGLSSIKDAQIISDPKGDFYLAVTQTPGQKTAQFLLSLLPDILSRFEWPKSMRWGENRFRWIRPLRRILCVFDGKPVPFELAGLVADNLTEGHRVMGRGPFTVENFAQYEQILRDQGKVLIRADDRRKKIVQGASKLCADKYDLIEDAALLDELTGIAEWPVALMGNMDEQFLALPDCVIVQAMRQHQKYLAVGNRHAKGQIAPRFIVVANLEAPDAGKAIVQGNQRVLTARLSDAAFFWEQDCKTKLEDRFDTLEGLIFYQSKTCKPISLKQKSQMVTEIAGMLTEPLDKALAKAVERAAYLSKCDLVTQSVGEFPSLQGKIGQLLAQRDGESADISEAMSAHYRIDGDMGLVTQYLALAERIVSLATLWVAGERVKGSGDPYGMRRAALDMARILNQWPVELALSSNKSDKTTLTDLLSHAMLLASKNVKGKKSDPSDIMRFIIERFKIWLEGQDQPIGRDFFDAVYDDGASLPEIRTRAHQLQTFFTDEQYKQDCTDLVSAYKRAINILSKEQFTKTMPLDPSLLEEQAEKDLHDALQKCGTRIDKSDKHDTFTAMMGLTDLRAPLDAFFDKVRVNVDNEALRHNRLALLAAIRTQMLRVADLSKIQIKGRE